MKKFNLHLILPSALAAALLWGCTTEKIEIHYLRLSEAVCSFQAEGGGGRVIAVDAAPAWEAVSSQPWLKIVEETPESFTIAADKNDTGEERSAFITVKTVDAEAQVKVVQLSNGVPIARYRCLDGFENTAVVSPSGRYVGGVASVVQEDDTWAFYPTIIDVETEESYVLGPVSESLQSLGLPYCITDSGMMFVTESNSGGCAVYSVDNNNFVLDKLPGYNWPPTVSAVSADGKYWAGYAIKDAEMYYALKWTDGAAVELPLPDKNFRDEEWFTGVLPRGMSCDGSIIYGTSWENKDYGMCYWEGENNEFHWVAEDLRKVTPVTLINRDGEEIPTHIANGMYCAAELTNISPDGKWIAGNYREESVNDKKSEIESQEWPAFYNTQTKTTVVMKEYAGNKAMAATNDGLGFISYGTMMNTDGFVVEIESGVYIGTIAEWVLSTYGIHIPKTTVTYVTPDSKVVTGMVMLPGADGAQWRSWYVKAAD